MIRRQQVRPRSQRPAVELVTEVTAAPVPDWVTRVVQNQIGVILKGQIGSGKAGGVRVPHRGPSTVVDDEVAVVLHHSVGTSSGRPSIPQGLGPVIQD